MGIYQSARVSKKGTACWFSMHTWGSQYEIHGNVFRWSSALFQSCGKWFRGALSHRWLVQRTKLRQTKELEPRISEFFAWWKFSSVRNDLFSNSFLLILPYKSDCIGRLGFLSKFKSLQRFTLVVSHQWHCLKNNCTSGGQINNVWVFEGFKSACFGKNGNR